MQIKYQHGLQASHITAFLSSFNVHISHRIFAKLSIESWYDYMGKSKMKTLVHRVNTPNMIHIHSTGRNETETIIV